jgi:two-component system chemotaxis response regulator CheY
MQMIRQEKQSKNPFVAIIVVTANTEIRHVMTTRDAGMTEFLAKPISAGMIYSRICSIIGRQRLFIRRQDFFGPDRRRRRMGLSGPERRTHSNSATERKNHQSPFNGSEKRPGHAGYQPPDSFVQRAR